MKRMRTLGPFSSEEYNDLKGYDFPLASSMGRLSHFAISFLLGKLWETLISPLQIPALSSSGGVGVAVESLAGFSDVGAEFSSSDAAMVATGEDRFPQRSSKENGWPLKGKKISACTLK